MIRSVQTVKNVLETACLGAGCGGGESGGVANVLGKVDPRDGEEPERENVDSCENRRPWYYREQRWRKTKGYRQLTWWENVG